MYTIMGTSVCEDIDTERKGCPLYLFPMDFPTTTLFSNA